jgi:hypothetical protein
MLLEGLPRSNLFAKLQLAGTLAGFVLGLHRINRMMPPRLTHELAVAIRQHGLPLEVRDEAGQQQFVILTKDDYRRLVDHEFRGWLQAGFDQADRGDVADWNTDDILAEARRRFPTDPAG